MEEAWVLVECSAGGTEQEQDKIRVVTLCWTVLCQLDKPFEILQFGENKQKRKERWISLLKDDVDSRAMRWRRRVLSLQDGWGLNWLMAQS